MTIKKKEIRVTVRNVLLSIFSFYLVFPLREVINKLFNMEGNLGGQFAIGIIGILIIAYLFKLE